MVPRPKQRWNSSPSSSPIQPNRGHWFSIRNLMNTDKHRIPRFPTYLLNQHFYTIFNCPYYCRCQQIRSIWITSMTSIRNRRPNPSIGPSSFQHHSSRRYLPPCSNSPIARKQPNRLINMPLSRGHLNSLRRNMRPYTK